MRLRSLAGFLRKPFTASNEIVPGVKKPTTILAEMLAIEMLQNLDATVSYNGSFTYVQFPSCRLGLHTSSLDNALTCHSILLTKGGPVHFDDGEKEIFLKAYKKWKKLHENHEEAKTEEARQNRALDIIANMQGVEA